MSNLIPFHCQNRQRKNTLLKLMQYKKILPYIRNSLRPISLILRALYQNLNKCTKKYEVSSRVPTWNRLSITISMSLGPGQVFIRRTWIA